MPLATCPQCPQRKQSPKGRPPGRKDEREDGKEGGRKEQWSFIHKNKKKQTNKRLSQEKSGTQTVWTHKADL